MELRDVLIRPLITERSTALMADNKYVFAVEMKANKILIRQAVEKIFKVKVLKVNTLRMEGKPKRMGRHQGKRPDYKKAIVTLAPGEKIAFFDGV
ncbi:MAG: 50S ribosomal protein L23, partial [Negativicutes bacterium]|nr:50S ribosomal protein L23 [Negativicutes bacterium]